MDDEKGRRIKPCMIECPGTWVSIAPGEKKVWKKKLIDWFIPVFDLERSKKPEGKYYIFWKLNGLKSNVLNYNYSW